jgi:hypothetical protein
MGYPEGRRGQHNKSGWNYRRGVMVHPRASIPATIPTHCSRQRFASVLPFTIIPNHAFFQSLAVAQELGCAFLVFSREGFNTKARRSRKTKSSNKNRLWRSCYGEINKTVIPASPACGRRGPCRLRRGLKSNPAGLETGFRLPMKMQKPEDRSQHNTAMLPILTPDSYSHAGLCSPIMAVRRNDASRLFQQTKKAGQFDYFPGLVPA